MKPGTFIALLCIGLGSAAHAACDSGLAERLHAKLHPGRLLQHELAVCEPWRGHPNRSIVVLPLPRTASEKDTQLDLDVLVVQQADNGNSERASIIGRLAQPHPLPTSVIATISDLRVDPARYKLAPGAHIFGLRTIRRKISGNIRYTSETVTLYQLQGTKLAPLLDELEVDYQRSESDDGPCNGEFQGRHGLLRVEPTRSDGYADLTLHRTESSSRNIAQDEECVTQRQPDHYQSLLLRFDGQHYRWPNTDSRGPSKSKPARATSR